MPGAPLPGLAPPLGITPAPAPTLALPTGAGSPKLSKIVLGPNGFGALRLGMTQAQARATHLVGAASTAPGQTCATARLLAAPRGGTTPSVFYSPTLGLAAIYAYPGITTPAGIAIGATLAQLRRAYPTWRGIQGDAGPGYVPAPGSTTAQYRIAVSDDHVIEIAIQLDNQDCYE